MTCNCKCHLGEPKASVAGHQLSLKRAEETWDPESYMTPRVAWQAVCSCGWVGKVQINGRNGWAHPDLRAASSANRHLRTMCETCSRLGRTGPHGLYPSELSKDDPRFRCAINHANSAGYFEKVKGSFEAMTADPGLVSTL